MITEGNMQAILASANIRELCEILANSALTLHLVELDDLPAAQRATVPPACHQCGLASLYLVGLGDELCRTVCASNTCARLALADIDEIASANRIRALRGNLKPEGMVGFAQDFAGDAPF